MASALDHSSNDELWRECSAWLTRWEMLRSDHRANRPQACIADFAAILRDGVLICRLLNKIDPGCIDMKDVNLKPTMAQFLCIRNIQIFLKACIFSFGLKESDLFEPLMLFDLSNFHKVLCTLSKLSLSTKALRGNIEGFTAQIPTRENEVIYQSLKSVELPYKSRATMETEYDHSKEAIYQDLLVLTPELEVLKASPTLEKRDFVIKELLDTEKNYVEVLGKLKKNFINPLKNNNVMKHKDHEIIFFKIEDLHNIHMSFYNELLRSKSDPMVRLSAVFMKWREKFLMYGEYCANLTRATTLLQELCDTNPNLNQEILEIEKEYNNGRFKLRDVLSVPMQRILKYHLLLEKLIDNTDPNHEEFNELKRSREAMLDVATYINEVARDSEHLAVIANLQENIVEWDVAGDTEVSLASFGRLIKDIELKIRAHDDQKTRTRYVFIFDKCVLLCKQLKAQQFAFRSIINIAEYHVEEVSNRVTLSKENRWMYSFYLVKNDNNNAYTIFVRSREARDQIMKAINDARDSLHPPSLRHTTHLLALHTFNTPTQCHHCSKYLKGLLYQGYRCSTCRIACHRTCISGSGRCGQPATTQGSPRPAHHPLQDRAWFAGEMDRAQAEERLGKRETGTYLVRIRAGGGQEEVGGKYALSLKTDTGVKHMKILSSADSSDQRKYYLSTCKFFNSIEELIKNYQQHSLKENFERLGINTKLVWPYKQIQVIAIRSYKPQDDKELELFEGRKLLVIDKEGYRDGWWKGRTEFNETGYFPSSFVRVESEAIY